MDNDNEDSSSELNFKIAGFTFPAKNIDRYISRLESYIHTNRDAKNVCIVLNTIYGLIDAWYNEFNTVFSNPPLRNEEVPVNFKKHVNTSEWRPRITKMESIFFGLIDESENIPGFQEREHEADSISNFDDIHKEDERLLRRYLHEQLDASGSFKDKANKLAIQLSFFEYSAMKNKKSWLGKAIRNNGRWETTEQDIVFVKDILDTTREIINSTTEALAREKNCSGRNSLNIIDKLFPRQ